MNTILIRAEDKNRWERRTPLVPKDLERLIRRNGIRAFVQKSDKRFFTEDAYADAGALIRDDMAPGDVIIGVKEIPAEKILPDKTYLFFSHTIKGQKENMPLLKKIMESGATLIDYEKITDDDNRRLIFFGRYAGDAGAIDILSLMGEYWGQKNIPTPFTLIRRAHEYSSVDRAKDHLRKVGELIRQNGLPEAVRPFVVGILGYGNVAGGARRMLECLPHQYVAPDDLIDHLSEETDPHRITISVFKEKDLARRTGGGDFRLQEYYDHPDRYENGFERFLPCVTLIVNAVYWEPRYPRFVTWDGLRRLYRSQDKPKLAGIADISCDTGGAVECNVKSTDSGMPAYQVDPLRQTVTDGHTGDGIVVLAVDNLPCELPADASTFFSGRLAPFLPNLLAADFQGDLRNSGLCPELEKAVIVYRGQLTPDFQYLRQYI